MIKKTYFSMPKEDFAIATVKLGGRGTGKSKKEAEQEAAKNALSTLSK